MRISDEIEKWGWKFIFLYFIPIRNGARTRSTDWFPIPIFHHFTFRSRRPIKFIWRLFKQNKLCRAHFLPPTPKNVFSRSNFNRYVNIWDIFFPEISVQSNYLWFLDVKLESLVRVFLFFLLKRKNSWQFQTSTTSWFD